MHAGYRNLSKMCLERQIFNTGLPRKGIYLLEYCRVIHVMEQLVEEYLPPELLLYGAGVLFGYLNPNKNASALTAVASSATLVLGLPDGVDAPPAYMYGPAFGLGIATGLMLKKYGLPPKMTEFKKYLPI